MSIFILDPSISSRNNGDIIILKSVINELNELFPDYFFLHSPTHEIISNVSINNAKKSHLRFMAGTNILSSHMRTYKQWQISLRQSFILNDIILMGVGWWQYQGKPDFYTRTILRNALSHSYNHSVRDNYTKNKLSEIGINNAINTGCPTMWRFTEGHCNKISTSKSDTVIVTLTDYNKDAKNDFLLIKELKKHYKNILFWPQGIDDLEYLKFLEFSDIELIPPNLDAFDNILRDAADVDFVGTRLHGGVRAMQHFRRALIVAVDNRAKEISADTGLPIAERGDLEAIVRWITHPQRTEISINHEAIRDWKGQFKKFNPEDIKNIFPIL